jgi:2-(1,2-epoxy-1,2-dihydrophenyl)acetyl-CoA isomerase
MPLGVGGEHQGPDRAIRDLWAVVHEHYDVAPVPERAWVAPDGTAVVHGWYEGSVRRTGEPVRAEFVHLLEVADDRLLALRQVTDTVAWRAP